MTGTRMCDRCWELDHRIRAEPGIAKRILADATYDRVSEITEGTGIAPDGREEIRRRILAALPTARAIVCGVLGADNLAQVVLAGGMDEVVGMIELLVKRSMEIAALNMAETPKEKH